MPVLGQLCLYSSIHFLTSSTSSSNIGPQSSYAVGGFTPGPTLWIGLTISGKYGLLAASKGIPLS
ncbi:hypothetical protein AMTR_s00010p00104990 [Amborella trichopoda]|uniref:Uncharacterized protein n=1 Tax=Amborella trichopoda TaxID=13333 RepID=W1NF58_AMBTC|nr:hypothetical protein AMTR_s00010p00104990 [Amborella trichopoda]